MCGIFGYHGTAPPQPEQLRQAAIGAGRRGPHGYGFAYRHHRRPMASFHEPGPLDPAKLPTTPFVSMIGHARLATVGDWRQIEQLQPIVVGQIALAHNGVITNPDELMPGMATDSIALAHAYAQMRMAGIPPAEALEKLLATAQQQAWAIAVLDDSDAVYLHRHYHPLWIYRDEFGTYLSSQPFHPDATLLPEDHVVALT